MNYSDDPYQTPKSDLQAIDTKTDETDLSRFDGMNDEDIKKLNKYSSDINYIGVGSILYAIGSLASFYFGYTETQSISILPILFFVYFCSSTYACFARPHWGDIIGFISSTIFLFAFPIGTLFGIIGIRAISKKRKLLFGNERFTDTELSEAAARIERKSA